jgi:nitric oxide reductase NorQ protein
VLKELKQSTRQRFVAIEFNYPEPALEKKILITETGMDADDADKLIRLAAMTRNLKGNGLDEGASTRLLVHAGKLLARGIAPRAACSSAIAEALTDDPEMLRAIHELIASLF